MQPATDKDINSFILLVDDEPLVLEVGTRMLQFLGYNVLRARDGQEALDLYKQNQNQLDVVILDMNMPGMNGAMVYDRLKTIQPNVKVLIASGYFDNHCIRNILKNGFTDFIQKPFNTAALSEKLAEILALG